MKDYASMSDIEISKSVGDAIGIDWANLDDNYHELCYWPELDDELNIFDPCNNPADAWPIVNASRISIMFDGTDLQYEGEHHEWCDAISSSQKFGIQHQSNPLRAAMIVFLMMKEGE